MAKTLRFGAAAWFEQRPRGARVLIPLVLGAFAGLGHDSGPEFGVALVLVTLTLAFLTVPTDLRDATWFGWLFGFGYFAITLRWLVEPFLVDPVRHGWMAPFAILLMAGGLALFWGFAFWVARWISGARPTVMVWVPVTLAAAELARGHVLSGFPWGMVSYTLIGGLGDVWFAWVGPYGTNLVVFAVAGGTAYCVQRGWTLIWPGLVVVLLATLGLNALTARAPDATQTTVRLIQPNAPQHQKWDPAWRDVFFDRAIAQTAAVSATGDAPDVVIWPETSVPALLDYAQPWMEQMSLAANGASVVAGVQRREGRAFFNSAVLIDTPQSVAAMTDKTHLVPFGEYIPLAWLLEPLGLGTLVDQISGFTPGTGNGVMQIDGLGLARILICYEGIFPEDMQRGEIRPDVLVIITNDAWFGTGAGPRQHLVQAQARAIEQGLPVVRAANTGISAVIDARGRIVGRVPLNAAGFLDSAVPAALPPTLYARIGDWPFVVLLALSVAAGVAYRHRFVVDPKDAHG